MIPGHAGALGRLLLAACVGLVAWSSVITAAEAHLAIRLDIQHPEDGQPVRPDTDVVVFAQPTLAGVTHAGFTAALDGRALDPATGRFSNQPVPLDIGVSTSKRIPLRSLAPGPHRFTISYRPDSDEPTRETTVEFTVRRPGGTLIPRLGAAAVAVAVAGAAILLRRRRKRT